VRVDDGALVLTWDVRVDPGATTAVSWSLDLDDPSLVVHGSTLPSRIATPSTEDLRDPRIARWMDAALGDLDGLRLTMAGHPDDEFYAAGAPWFFTLFGRDSLWAARLALAADVGIAASTLRVLARLQGDRVDVATAQQPGKIPHELRSAPLALPGEDVLLPPLYYGTVDATLLWVCLLADAFDAGMPRDEVEALVPALRAALTWMTDYGDGSGHGFIDYIDESGHGLANQGWKDSGDSIQWRDGSLAKGPIALCEVQGYAYEAAQRGADVLDALGERGGDELRAWAAALRERFRAAYWVQTPEGRYPAIALDADQRPVDTLTSNIGHLIGTGILDTAEEAHVASLLLGESMSSGFGIRTMSTGAAGYWPLSYHGGSVWAHDTAIAVHGLSRAGLHIEALQVVEGLLAAAEGFDFRMPELYSGDASSISRQPTPYPAACRPQAWAAAAAVTCAEAVRAAGV
jgi:glycogen debranching enzyme